MTRHILLIACTTTALAASSMSVRAVPGPEADGSYVETCRIPIGDGEVQARRAAWLERLGNWLHRQWQPDSVGRGGYYLRSPLLYAFGPDTREVLEIESPEACAPRTEPSPASTQQPTSSEPSAAMTPDASVCGCPTAADSGLFGRVRSLGPGYTGQDAETDQDNDAHTDPGG